MAIQVLDGGLGTSLADKYGVKFTSATTPLWSSDLLISDPDTLVACQRDFSNEGIDVLLTATYQVSIEGFARTKTAEYPNGIPRDAIGRYLTTAVDVAEKAIAGRKDHVKLALSLGPYGACMIPGQEYSGKYDAKHEGEEALFQWHLERLKLFTEIEGLINRVHYVAFETLPRLDEIRAVRRAIEAAGIQHKFWVSCVVPGEEDELPDQSNISEVVEAMLGPLEGGRKPWGIGMNCTKIHKLPRLVPKFEDGITKMIRDGYLEAAPTLVLYPDGTNGEVYNTTTQKWELPEGQGERTPRVSWKNLDFTAI